MNNLKLEKDVAKKLYPDVPSWFKEVLEQSFDKETFKTFHYTDIKTYEDAVAYKPVSRKNIIYDTDTIDVIAYKKLKHIVSVINAANFKASYGDSSQKKWYPYFETRISSGCAVFGFQCSGYNYDGTYSAVGLLLVLDCQEKATYMGNQFTSLYETYYTGNE